MAKLDPWDPLDPIKELMDPIGAPLRPAFWLVDQPAHRMQSPGADGMHSAAAKL